MLWEGVHEYGEDVGNGDVVGTDVDSSELVVVPGGL